MAALNNLVNFDTFTLFVDFGTDNVYNKTAKNLHFFLQQ